MRRIAATLAIIAIVFSTGCTSESDAELVKQFREDADLGYPKAQFNLGVMYANGRGGLKNDVEAVKWYRKAAEQGNALAQVALGDISLEAYQMASPPRLLASSSDFVG